MTLIPELPPPKSPAESEWGIADVLPRYEDITQDGRVVLTSLMQGLGAAVWRGMLDKQPAINHLRNQGVLPILRRVAVVGEPGPFSAAEPIRYRGTWRLAREESGERLFLNMWLEAWARSGSTFAPPAPDAPPALAGRVFAEHVVTKPFASKEERKVTRLEAPGIPPLPEAVHHFEATEDLLALAGGAKLTEADEVAFGLMHTDSNQHVNSLVYPRLFEEAVIERLDRSGAPDAGRLLVRGLEMRWRKPCFAGDRVKIPLAIVRDGGELGRVPSARALAVGAFGDVDAPHCTLAAWFG